jgi:hypothetical protein
MEPLFPYLAQISFGLPFLCLDTDAQQNHIRHPLFYLHDLPTGLSRVQPSICLRRARLIMPSRISPRRESIFPAP